ncbi:alpha-hydroxy-acid oxidizing enzyme [Actinocatenispora thailandica]|uniref:Alpha-hydroxy-acid oxidizing enzyme n=1 Tax=Actinocatenispora thailandica TaxID=227318 RepID=A0A7R7HX51_9ACTN|nr:alpha-hydroxy acid oxidase [Actinocatenispora thailandica]BCJ34763.1 alpha-hydroxy-acid oxidizing enzyme [Actinocatenispora thailandica]
MLRILAEQQRAAADLLPREVHDYYATGSGDEVTLGEATAAWRRYRFRPRIGRDMTTIDTAIRLFGDELALPVLAAPTAFHRLAHPDGEVATIRGVHRAGSLLVLSSRCSRRIEDVAAAATGPWWFQVYLYAEASIGRQVVRRAVDAGAGALVLTMDTPYTAAKRRLSGVPVTDDDYLVNFVEHLPAGVDPFEATTQDPACTLDALHELTGHGIPVLAKGVLRGDDALACLDAGAAGIVVSNHGGRQLDRAVPTSDALTEVVAAVSGRVPVLVDGGIRSGLDVLTALGLGADAVLVGRPILWALAADGAAGVTAALDAVRDDLAAGLALAGATSPADLPAGLVTPVPR